MVVTNDRYSLSPPAAPHCWANARSAMRIASAGEMVTGQGPVRYQVQIAST